MKMFFEDFGELFLHTEVQILERMYGSEKRHASQEKTSGCKNFELELDKTGSQIAG
ncbi:MAG: hypothetical protein ACP5LX_03250 [Nitrososphaeria archaeon]|jgi:hypothetical protein